MNARSEGDETPLWLDAHACQEARSGGINASGLEVSRERNFQRVRRTHEYRHSHSEWIVGRSRAFMDNPG